MDSDGKRRGVWRRARRHQARRRAARHGRRGAVPRLLARRLHHRPDPDRGWRASVRSESGCRACRTSSSSNRTERGARLPPKSAKAPWKRRAAMQSTTLWPNAAAPASARPAAFMWRPNGRPQLLAAPEAIERDTLDFTAEDVRPESRLSCRDKAHAGARGPGAPRGSHAAQLDRQAHAGPPGSPGRARAAPMHFAAELGCKRNGRCHPSRPMNTSAVRARLHGDDRLHR